jgi:hypothetical protein
MIYHQHHMHLRFLGKVKSFVLIKQQAEPFFSPRNIY